MKAFRSVAAILFGIVLAFAMIAAAEAINAIVNQPDDGRTFAEFQDSLQKDMKAMKAWIESLPESAMVATLLGWEVGAFLGGGAAALIAGYRRRLHAGVIGAFVLAFTVFNIVMMKFMFDYSYSDLVILLGLLLPIPASLLAGQLVHMMLPPTPPPTAPQT